MATFDIFALCFISLCIIVSIMRGIITEIISLIAWVVAFIVARTFALPFSKIAFQSLSHSPELAVTLSFFILFIAAWLAQHFLRALLTKSVNAMGLGSLNRIFGGIFGAVKGIFLVTVTVIICSFTDLPKTDGWKKSISARHFEALAKFSIPHLPQAITDKIKLNPIE